MKNTIVQYYTWDIPRHKIPVNDISDNNSNLGPNGMMLFRRGLTDDLGAEAMMMDALEKVENEIKKPLMRSDKKGMALLLAEFDKINKK